LTATISLSLFLSSVSFIPVPLRAAISIDIVNATNGTIHKAEIRFRILDYVNVSRIRFFNTTNSTIQVPNKTWIVPFADESGFTLYVPEWPSNERAQFIVDNISIGSWLCQTLTCPRNLIP
jgi:hypothetical protein